MSLLDYSFLLPKAGGTPQDSRHMTALRKLCRRLKHCAHFNIFSPLFGHLLWFPKQASGIRGVVNRRAPAKTGALAVALILLGVVGSHAQVAPITTDLTAQEPVATSTNVQAMSGAGYS